MQTEREIILIMNSAGLQWDEYCWHFLDEDLFERLKLHKHNPKQFQRAIKTLVYAKGFNSELTACYSTNRITTKLTEKIKALKLPGHELFVLIITPRRFKEAKLVAHGKPIGS